MEEKNAEYAKTNAARGVSDGDAPIAFNPGQKIQLARLASDVLASELRQQTIRSFVESLAEAPTAVQLTHARPALKAHCNSLLTAAHHYLVFHLGVDAPGAHHECALAASWLTPTKMTDEQTTEVVNTVLEALAADDWASVAIKKGLVLAADGANASKWNKWQRMAANSRK